MLLGTLGVSLLGNMLAGKGILRAVYRNKEKKINIKSWLFIFTPWFWKKWQYNFELFKKWVKQLIYIQI